MRVSARKPLPTAFSHLPFSVGAASKAGLPPSRLRAQDLESPFHGIRRPVGPVEPWTDDPIELARRRHESLVRDCLAFLERRGRPVIFSHVTAARLYRMPLPWRLENRAALDVAALSPAHAPQGAGVIGHRLNGGSIAVREIHGIPVPGPVNVWLQLGALLSVDDLIIAGDALVRRKLPLATVDSIHTAVRLAHRRRGLANVRKAAPDIRSGTDSAAETRTRLIIVRGGLPEPAIGHTVYDRNGFFVGTPDLSFVTEKIALDYEGDIHRVSSTVFGEDIERREQFQDAGWRHIRVVKKHLESPHLLVDRVAFALAERRAGR